MAKENVKAKTTGDLESRVTMLEKRTAALEKLSKRFTRKKREYTDEQRAAIRARLLAGQEAAGNRRENEAKSMNKGKTATESKKAKPVPTLEKA
jgi:hypothetical protein